MIPHLAINAAVLAINAAVLAINAAVLAQPDCTFPATVASGYVGFVCFLAGTIAGALLPYFWKGGKGE